VRVAVVGCGEFGRNHARVYSEMPNAQLVGVLDDNPERAAQVAQEFHTRAFQSLEELPGAVVAASVAVPTVVHRDIGCQLLEKGIDALIEKPIARTVLEADALLDCAKKHSRILQVGHVERFNPAVLAVEPIVNRPQECARALLDGRIDFVVTERALYVKNGAAPPTT